MNTNDFLNILRNPSYIKNEQVFDIEDIVKNFPYFQAARVIYLKGLKIQNSFRYNQALKTTAAYTTDRSVLFNFITDESFNSFKTEEEASFIKEMENHDNQVIENIEAATKREYITDEQSPETPLLKSNDLLGDSHRFSTDVIDIDEIYINKDIDWKGEVTSASEDKLNDFENYEDVEQSLLTETPLFEIDNLVSENEKILEEADKDNEVIDFIQSVEEDIITEKEKIIQLKPQDVQDNKRVANDSDFNFEFDNDEEIVIITEAEVNMSAIETLDNVNLVFEPYREEQEEAIVNTPLNFTKEDTFSFKEWLQLSSLNPIDRSKTRIDNTNKSGKMQLIDAFIEKSPKIKPQKSADITPVIENKEVDESLVMTETLAQVYTQQKKYDSAIKAYEILSLKFPKKSSFFANQIKKLKKLKQNNKNT